MPSFLERAGNFWVEFKGRLTARRETTPIDSVAKLQEFVSTRSVYVAQKTLYGYVKTRMGTRYPRVFEDDRIIASLDIAKHHVFAGCLSDLTVYAVGTALHDHPVGNEERQALAQGCFAWGLRENTGEAPQEFSAAEATDEFSRRLELTEWRVAALQPDNFTASPRALFRWAPIAENLKKLDAEVVENSIKYTWREIREHYQKRLAAAAVCEDWSRRATG